MRIGVVVGVAVGLGLGVGIGGAVGVAKDEEVGVGAGGGVGSASPPPQALNDSPIIISTTAATNRCFTASLYHCFVDGLKTGGIFLKARLEKS